MKNDNKLFSIVIPAYNREKTVGRAIQSILDQTYENTEIIVVDDGSKDRTRECVGPFLSDNRVTYLHQENGGAQRARNNGLHHSKGEYIIFLDSDDALEQACLEKVVGVFQQDPEISAVYFLAKGDDGTFRPRVNDHLQGSIYKDVLKKGYLTSSSFIAMRRKIFETIGEWDIAFPASQDDDTCFRVAKHTSVALINEVLGTYYSDAGQGNQISSSTLRMANGWWILWNKYENDVLLLCGENVIRHHYLECAYRYYRCGEKSKYKECMLKVKKYSHWNTYMIIEMMLKFRCRLTSTKEYVKKIIHYKK